MLEYINMYNITQFVNILLWWIQVKAKGTLMEMVAADWLKSDKREDDLGSRPGGIVQVLIIIVCSDSY